MKLELYRPVNGFVINQVWGNNPPDPLNSSQGYYARFRDERGNPLRGHNGVDLQASHGQPVYSPCDGVASYVVDNYKGDGIYIITDKMYDYRNSQALFRIVLWHLCPKEDVLYPIKIDTTTQYVPVKTGQLLGYADNTGAPFESTGDHLHFGLYPENPINGKDYTMGFNEIESGNGFNGSIDPMPFFNRYFASDYDQIEKIKEQEVILAQKTVELIAQDPVATPQQKLGWLQIILNFLRSL